MEGIIGVTEVVMGETDFERELRELLKKYAKKDFDYTPDQVQAKYVKACFEALDVTVEWYTRG